MSGIQAPRRALALLLAAATLLSSCAYFNTYYLARKFYFRATAGAPYSAEGGLPAAAADFNKSVDYSKKLMAQYSKSKWVDDAYVLWARALLGKDDPIQTVNMLQDFSTRFPRSPLRNEAVFYLGVGYRQARRYTEAVVALDEFLKRAPRHELAPYAHLERARALMSLDRPAQAAEAAGQVLDHFSRSKLVDRARLARAEARFAQGAFDEARADYRVMGQRARTDDERFGFLLNEAGCLEAARKFPEGLALLRDALSHEREPLPPDTAGGKPLVAPVGVGVDRWGRLMLRVGSAHMLAGRLDESLAAYRRVAADYPRSALGAEAQFRIGYAYETVGDDFDRARSEYARVKDQAATGPFITQAADRLANLDRLAQFRNASGDSLQKRAEAGFLLAEVYLFQLGKPERALDEYRKVAGEFAGSAWAAKALNAQAWVMSRKLDRRREADSLFWMVVRQYPATEEQLAARDYLEMAGETVPDSLIKLPPPPPPPPVDTSRHAEPAAGAIPGAPAGTTPGAPAPLGQAQRGLFAGAPDSLRLGARSPAGGLMFPSGTSGLGSPFAPSRPDSARYAQMMASAQRDSAGGFLTSPLVRPTSLSSPRPAPLRVPTTLLVPAPPDSFWLHVRSDTSRWIPPRDTTRAAAPRDTARTAAPPDTSRSVMPRASAPRDTTRVPAPRTSAPAPRDTTRAVASPDTARAVPPRAVTPTPAPRDTARSVAPPDTTRSAAPRGALPSPAPRDSGGVR